jgi:hypothetical protein
MTCFADSRCCICRSGRCAICGRQCNDCGRAMLTPLPQAPMLDCRYCLGRFITPEIGDASKLARARSRPTPGSF